MPVVKKQQAKPSPRRNGSVLDRIQDVTEIPDEQGMKVLIYGRSKTGKTLLSSTFPKPAIILAAEDGKRTVKNVEGLKFIRFKNSEELDELTEHAASGKYATVILDTASRYQDMVLAEILGLEELPTQKSWGMASQSQYGQCSLQCKERFRRLLDIADNCRCHIVILAQEREFNTDTESELLMPFVGAGLTPSVTGWLNTAVDYIMQTFIREGIKEKVAKINGKDVTTKTRTGKIEYLLRIAPHPIYTTGFRAPRREEPLPEAIADPSYDKLVALIEECP